MQKYEVASRELYPSEGTQGATNVYLASDVDARVAELEKALRESKRSHYYCEDSWYSCPAHPDGTSDPDRRGKPCECGADEWNARIDSLLMVK